LKTKVFVCAVVVVLLSITLAASTFTAEKPSDPTVDKTPVKYVPKLADLLYGEITTGDVAEADILALGDDVAYIGLLLNGDASNAHASHLFLK
jgi:hypothetical protein